MELCVFSKHLQEFDIPTLAEKLKSINVHSVDLTVRAGGHVEPSQVKEKLPEAVEILKQSNINVAMVTTEVTSLDEQYAQNVLEAISAVGVRYYKIGYYRYFDYGSIQSLLLESKSKLADMAALNKELGIWGGYHNHSASFLGANPLHIYDLVEELDVDAIGCYWDIGHAVIEGLAGSWDASFDHLKDRIRMIAIKDLAVNLNNKDWRCDVVDLGHGAVPWDRVCSWLKQISDQLGVASIHGEYPGSGDHVLTKMAADKDYFNQQWQAAGDPVLSTAL